MEGIWEDVTKLDDLTLVTSAFHAGTDDDGSQILIGRILYGNELIPGKLIVGFNRKDFYFPFDTKEIKIPIGVSSPVSVLINDGLYWDPAIRSSGEVSSNAIIGGKARNGAPFYIGRVRHEFIYTPGKIDTYNNCLYISFAGSEFEANSYEVLVKAIHNNEKPIQRQRFRESETIKDSPGDCGCLNFCRSIGEAFAHCKINITNCTCFKIN